MAWDATLSLFWDEERGVTHTRDLLKSTILNVDKAAARKAKQKAYKAKPEVKAARKAYDAEPRRRAAQKAYEARPERKAARKAYAQQPERKEAQKAYDAKPEIKAVQKARRERLQMAELLSIFD